jgi:hypothetical protein
MPPQKQRGNNGNGDKPDRLHRGIKNDRIYRMLLSDIGGKLTQYRIAKIAQAQQIQVSLLLRKLENSHLVSRTHVVDAKGLLTRWSRLKVKYQSQSYMLPSIMDALKTTKLEYGLTTYRAESMVNRYLFTSRTEFYIRPEDSDLWHALLVKEGALVGGGNVRVRWYDDQVLYNSFFIEGFRLVTIPQLIVDLIREGSSAAEAAEQMIQKYHDLMRLNQLNLYRPRQTQESTQ